MNGADVRTAWAGESPALPCDSRRLLGLSRGFACLFWGMPVLAAAHAAAMLAAFPAQWLVGWLLVSFLPLLCGLWRLRMLGDLTAGWRRRIERSLLMALVVAYLAPFLAWWSQVPGRTYFAANAALHYAALVAMLAGLNRLAGEAGRWMDDPGLRREAGAGLGMVLWLSGCTVAALAWLFHRAGVLDAGIVTISAQLARLPQEARTLFLLPYAMTAYVAWRTKETGFRLAVRGAAR